MFIGTCQSRMYDMWGYPLLPVINCIATWFDIIEECHILGCALVCLFFCWLKIFNTLSLIWHWFKQWNCRATLRFFFVNSQLVNLFHFGHIFSIQISNFFNHFKKDFKILPVFNIKLNIIIILIKFWFSQVIWGYISVLLLLKKQFIFKILVWIVLFLSFPSGSMFKLKVKKMSWENSTSKFRYFGCYHWRDVQ